MLSHDALVMVVALWLSFSTRLGLLYWPKDFGLVLLVISSVVVGLVAFIMLGIYEIVVRYIDSRAATRLTIAAACSAISWFVLGVFSGIDGLPRSVGFIYFATLLLLLYFSRVAVALVLNGRGQGGRTRPDPAKPKVGTAIYGANAVGCSLAEALRGHDEFQVRFFVDDDPTLIGRTMLGYPIRSSRELATAAATGLVRHVVLALPDASRTERLALVSRLSSLALSVMTLPSHHEIMSGRGTFSDVRPIHVDDLLARETVPPIPQLIEAGIKGRSVLVTGAGGSIGSEICRQIVKYNPKRIVMLDHSEFALFAIERELFQRTDHTVELVPIVGSLLNKRVIQRAITSHGVEAVFHAAAYKHVPLLETNEIVGVENNFIGTKNLADACIAAGVERMTMISTDKAVRPSSVMGASKRLAELYVQALAGRPNGETCFGIVRFGNVLDSSGSVVQLFRRQILEGGPITVTHEDVTRFFMSIPEATELVLQANAMANGGEVYVLEMGEPIRIADLARTMVALSGMTERSASNPKGDIAIAFVGLRPGEKLHEELFVGTEIQDTAHPQIKMARERCIPLAELSIWIQELSESLAMHDANRLRQIMANILDIDQDVVMWDELAAS